MEKSNSNNYWRDLFSYNYSVDMTGMWKLSMLDICVAYINQSVSL